MTANGLLVVMAAEVLTVEALKRHKSDRSLQGRRTLSLLVENCGRVHQGRDLDKQHKGDRQENSQFIAMPAIKSCKHSVGSAQVNFDLCSCRASGRHFIKQYPLAGFYNIQPGYETQLY